MQILFDYLTALYCHVDPKHITPEAERDASGALGILLLVANTVCFALLLVLLGNSDLVHARLRGELKLVNVSRESEVI